MRIGYSIIERFDATDGETWTKYVEWSKLTHLREVITLDRMLCPSGIEPFAEEDYAHSIPEWRVVGIFDDLKYTRARAGGLSDSRRLQVVAVSREPTLAEFDPDLGTEFRFVGFDLNDEQSWTSALTNCGGFERAFAPEDLSPCGLIENARRAYEVRDALRTMFPNDAHAQCTAWAIWRENRNL